MLRLSRMVGIGFLLLSLITFVGRLFGVPLGNGLANVPLGPAGEPVTITIWYGTEKRDWLEASKASFERTNPSVNGHPIIIQLRGVGSAEMAERIGREQFAAGDPLPTVASPAASLWLPVMDQEWAARNSTPLIATGNEAPQPLVLTPLVLVAWQQRADVLWPNGATNGEFWTRIHTALTAENWAAIGGDPQWGQVKFGHTSPLLSNSGAQALVLMAYGYHNKTSGLSVADVTDPDFVTWLSEIQRTIPQFGESTGTFMNEMVLKGPGAYDMALVYENLAIGQVDAQTKNGRIEQAQGRQGQPIRIYYPPATTISDHPYAILQAPWVTADQRAAAVKFRDFLLAQPQQEQALQFGFRPANPNVAIATSDPQNPFVRYRDFGVQVQIDQQVETPAAQTLTELLEVWRRGRFV
ncbi:MAG: substrate-binding domain-containing protein [Roseiflexaceae bacterium]|nr:substrate-binding domain-containing protein [Roseiflexaceae bacterium]